MLYSKINLISSTVWRRPVLLGLVTLMLPLLAATTHPDVPADFAPHGPFFTSCPDDTEAPFFTAAGAGNVLYTQNFATPNIAPVEDLSHCWDDLSHNQGVNALWSEPGFTFSQPTNFTCETIFINGPKNTYSDPSGIGGDYCLSMFRVNSTNVDRLALLLDVGTEQFLNLRMDVSGITITGGCTALGTLSAQTFTITAYDQPGGAPFDFDADNIVLDQTTVTTPDRTGLPAQQFLWGEVIAGLDVSDATDGNVVIEWTISAGNYAALDNIVLTAGAASAIQECPDNVTIEAVSSAGTVYNYTAPVAGDNCDPNPVTTQSVGEASGATFPIGVTTNTFTAIDASNNEAIPCTFTVTVSDTEPPVPPTLGELTDPCSVNPPVPTAEDAVAGTVTGTTTTTFPITETTTITWTFTDGTNSSTATQEVVIEDLTSAVAACSTTVELTLDAETVTLTAADLDNGSDDNCGAAPTLTITDGQTVFGCDDIGQPAVTVTLSAQDTDNAPTTCTSQVTVVAGTFSCNGAPTITCAPQTVDADGNCEGAAAGADFVATSNDPDGNMLTFSVSPAGPYALGVTSVTVTADDNNGGTATCSTTITVEDNTAPTFVDQTSVTLFDNGGFEFPNATPEEEDCGGGIDSHPGINHYYGDANNTFVQKETVEVATIDGTPFIDASGTGGNYAIGMFNNYQEDRLALIFDNQGKTFLNVAMDIAPTHLLSCIGGTPAATTLQLSIYDAPTGTFNSLAPGTLLDRVVVTSGAPNADPFDLNWTAILEGLDVTGATNGTIALEWDVQSGTYMLFDNLVITASNVSASTNCPQDLTVSCLTDLPIADVLVGFDNCDPNPTVDFTQSTIDNGINDQVVTRTWTVVDAAGNNGSSCTQTITISDTEAPTFNACPSTHTANLGTGGTVTVALGDLGVTATDNCGTANLSLDAGSDLTFGCADLGAAAGTITVNLNDGNGNAAAAPCVITVNVTDTGNECCDIAITSVATANLGCPGANEGTVTVTATCTTCTSIEYSIDGTNYQSSNVFTGVADATFTVSVRDMGNNGCSATETNVVVPDGTDTEAPVVNGTQGGAGWDQAAKALAADAAVGDQLGYSVSISGNDAIVGALRDDDGGFSSGSAYLFNLSSSLPSVSVQCSAAQPNPLPTATDNCHGTVTGTPDVTFPITTQGTTTVTWTFTDGVGNSSTATQDFVIEDTTDPVLACKTSFDANLGTGATVTVTAADLQTGAVTDNCASGLTAAIQSGNTVTFGCNDLGNNAGTITLEVSDGNGNDATCDVTINVTDTDSECYTCDIAFSVEDDQADPVVPPPFVTGRVVCGNDGSITVNANCASCTSIEYGISPDPNGIGFQSSNVFTGLADGDYTVTIRDAAENSCSATMVATVGECVGELPGNGSDDDCDTETDETSSIAWILLDGSETNASCTSGTDICGTKTFCYGLEYTPQVSGILTSYTTGFLLACVDGSTPLISNASCVMTDNSFGAADCANGNGAFFNSSGNSGGAAMVMLTKDEPIILHQICLTLPDETTVNLEEDDITDITMSITVAPVLSSDDPILVTDFPDYDAAGIDAAGNYPPVVTAGTIDDCYDDVAAAEAAALAATTSSDDYTAVGDLEIEASTAGDCAAVITVTVEDACGLVTTVTYSTRIDNEAPAVTNTLNVLTVEGCTAANVPAAATDVAGLEAMGVLIADNCTSDANLTVTVTSETNTGSCPIVVTRVYTITDECGKSVTASQTINVEDTTDPEATGSLTITDTEGCDLTVLPAAQTTVAGLTGLPGNLVITDNCTAPMRIVNAVDVIDDSACPIVVTRTYTIADACGNDIEVVHMLRIVDTQAPTVTTGTIDACYTTVALAEAAALAATSFTDNCLGTVTEVATNDGDLCNLTITVTGRDACMNPTTTTYTTQIVGTDGPTEVGGPAATSAEIQTSLDVVEPTPPVFEDACGNTLTGVGPVIDNQYNEGDCSGTITYTWTYTNCAGTESTWTFTYNIDCQGLNIRLFLEGSYLGGGTLSTALNDNNLLPGQDNTTLFVDETPFGHPYQTAPWLYNAHTGTAYGDPTHEDATGSEIPYPAHVSDWVIVTVRENGILPINNVWTCTGWIHENGEVTFPEACPITLTPGNTYAIVVEHRNHLAALVENATLDAGATHLTHDFTTVNSYAPTFRFGQKQMSDGNWALFTGNADQTSSRVGINSADRTAWRIQQNLRGYYLGDFDQSLQVESADETLWKNNQNKTSGIRFD